MTLHGERCCSLKTLNKRFIVQHQKRCKNAYRGQVGVYALVDTEGYVRETYFRTRDAATHELAMCGALGRTKRKRVKGNGATPSPLRQRENSTSEM